eukprot:5004814-Pyramimonas_sp.AAC.1
MAVPGLTVDGGYLSCFVLPVHSPPFSDVGGQVPVGSGQVFQGGMLRQVVPADGATALDLQDAAYAVRAELVPTLFEGVRLREQRQADRTH